jgi:hypothetical protein
MKKIILFALFLFVISFTEETYAQNKFHIGFNGGYVLQGPSKGLFDGGDNAWTMELNASYSINPEIKVNIQSAYYNFPNYRVYYNGVAAYPNEFNSNSINNSFQIDQSAKIYQFAFGVTFVSNNTKWIRPFISVNAGLSFFNYTVLVYKQSYGPAVVIPPVAESLETNKGFASVGIGIQIPVADKFNLNLQTICSSTLDNSKKIQNFFPVLCGIEYSF